MWSVYFKGIAMGAADIVPGVSGGTIAFITGIYERLITALSSLDRQCLAAFRERGVRGVWEHIDGTFLLVLFAGILTSVVSAARLISYLLSEHGILLWSFFFGLILGSVFFIVKSMKTHTFSTGMGLLLGALAAYFITVLTPAEIALNPVTLFCAGAIAICAMILPGISGSFLLLIMGMYGSILQAVKDFDIGVLLIFISGCVVGLLSFTHFLKWLLRHYHDVTLAVLTGFMLGSLNKVWPWKQTVEYRLNSHGESTPLVQLNILPHQYEQLTGESSAIVLAVMAFLTGLALVLVLEWVQRRERS
jgi:putative membrane protein